MLTVEKKRKKKKTTRENFTHSTIYIVMNKELSP